MSQKPDNHSTVTVEVKMAWWWKWLYEPGVTVALFFSLCVDIEAEPNWERIEYWTRKAIRTKVVK